TACPEFCVRRLNSGPERSPEENAGGTPQQPRKGGSPRGSPRVEYHGRLTSTEQIHTTVPIPAETKPNRPRPGRAGGPPPAEAGAAPGGPPGRPAAPGPPGRGSPVGRRRPRAALRAPPGRGARTKKTVAGGASCHAEPPPAPCLPSARS